MVLCSGRREGAAGHDLEVVWALNEAGSLITCNCRAVYQVTQLQSSGLP